MKNIIVVILMLFGAFGLQAQQEPFKLVFDVSSSNPDVHNAAARHLDLMSEAYPDSEFEMVVYSGAIDLVDKEASPAAETLKKSMERGNVSIVVCKMTMDRHKMGESDLIPGITSVPDGIYELISKQKEGWQYIKEAQ